MGLQEDGRLLFVLQACHPVGDDLQLGGAEGVIGLGLFLAADQAAQQGQAARLVLEGVLEEVEVGDADVGLLQLGRLGVGRAGIQRDQRHLRLGAQHGFDVEGGG
ncbi:hypothetical protein D3C72_1537750 [compost metagenome]